jgi:hypothetical protein
VANDPTPEKLTVAKLGGGQDPHWVAAPVKKKKKKKKKTKRQIFFKHCASNATYFKMHLFQCEKFQSTFRRNISKQAAEEWHFPSVICF